MDTEKLNPIVGSFGVDIFFIISGFVMAMVVSNGETPILFAINRISRIIPIYWILTTCLLFLAIVKPDLLNSTTSNIYNYLKSIFFIPYFKENGTLHPMLAVGWTLNYEVLFYTSIWASLVINRGYFMQLTCLIIIALFSLSIAYNHNSVVAAFFGNTLLFEFIMGFLVYIIYSMIKDDIYYAHILFSLSISVLAFMIYYENTGYYMERLLAFGVPSFFFVLFFISSETLFMAANKNTINLFTRIGDASYATYLSHYYVVESIRKILYLKYNLINPYSIIGIIFIITTALIVGHFIYIYIDKPFSKYFKRKLNKYILTKFETKALIKGID
jgi:peptidoglycan/LPS O-acetylase OafA/YrhL